MQPQLADWSLAQLEAGLQRCAQREGAAFVLRGLLVWERLRRVQPQRGGRGRRDVAGVGRLAVQRSLAKQLNLAAPTLKKDVQIVTTFFLHAAPLPALQTSILHDPSFPRVFYETALSAGEQAWEALEMAACRRTQASEEPYTIGQFRKEVAARFGVASPATTRPVRLDLDVTTRQALRRLAKLWHTDASEVVRRAIATLLAAEEEAVGSRQEAVDRALAGH